MLGISKKEARYLKRMEKLLDLRGKRTSDCEKTRKSEVCLSSKEKQEADLKMRSTRNEGFMETVVDDLKLKNEVWNRLNE